MKTKEEKARHYNELAQRRGSWRSRNRYYYAELETLISTLVPPGKKVLEIGCGTGELLNSTAPSAGTGIDFSENMIELAKKKFPGLRFTCDNAEDLHERETYDYIILSDVLGELGDVWQAFREMHKVTDTHSRVVITHYNYLWEPLIRLADMLGLKMPQDYQNWLSPMDIKNILDLNGYEIVKRGQHLLLPIYIPLLSNLLNRYIEKLPFLKRLCMVQYFVANEDPSCKDRTPILYTVSVIIPCRNERGNIEETVLRVPSMGSATELIFVDGASTDGTVEKIEEMILKWRGLKNIRLIHQTYEESFQTTVAGHTDTPPNKMLKLGKGNAVRQGFDAATGDILMILDSDLTVPPEDLPKFYDAIASGKGELINGTRLVYQMEKQAMRTLNLLGNKFFSWIFSWLLGQPIKDTLCGTKVLFRRDYEKINGDRAFFGNLDPFGDFDLLFGATKQNLKIIEVPVRYHRRTYGDTKIERFRHGWLLLKMAFVGLRKLKFFN
jgi:glycosyltransferase involved in cell wall biosynthesis/SAM-dependent methyltransferase